MQAWTRDELRALRALSSPWRIQQFIDALAYDVRPDAISPRRVLRERTAHCMSGALFAAAALRVQGHAPLLLDLRAVNDDDHVLAIFRVDGLWGAIAKSNTTVLRFREPAYRDVRELVMSYFDLYFNTVGQKTLREFSVPLDLRRFDARGWMFSEDDLQYLCEALDSIRHYRIVAPRRRLSPVAPYLLEAGLMGANPDGLFKASTGRRRNA